MTAPADQREDFITAPKYPAGPLESEGRYEPQRRGEIIAVLEGAPAVLWRAVAGLSEGQLDTRYRNWTVRQIVHHLADSHVNSYVRFKWTLTEERPTIKAYDEDRWVALEDSRTGDAAAPLALLALSAGAVWACVSVAFWAGYEVFAARDVRHDRMVAIKIVRQDCSTPQLEDRFESALLDAVPVPEAAHFRPGTQVESMPGKRISWYILTARPSYRQTTPGAADNSFCQGGVPCRSFHWRYDGSGARDTTRANACKPAPSSSR